MAGHPENAGTVSLGTVPGWVADKLRDVGAPPGIVRTPSYRMLAHHPEALAGWREMSWRLRNGAIAPGRLRELAIVRIAVLGDAVFERQAHENMAREHGVTDDDGGQTTCTQTVMVVN